MKSLITTFVAICLLSSPLFADTVILAAGGFVKGKIVRENDEMVEVKSPFGSTTIEKEDIEKIVREKGPWAIYDEKRGNLDGSADAHYRLGLWCKEQGLRKEAEKEFRAAIAVDPDHALARKELGYFYYKGSWHEKQKGPKQDSDRPVEAKLGKILVLHKGRWISPEKKKALESRPKGRDKERGEKRSREKRSKPRKTSPQIRAARIPVRRKGEFFHAATPHFLLATNVDAQFARDVAVRLEPLHRTYCEFFASLGIPRKNVTRTRVRIFADKASFDRYNEIRGKKGLRNHYDCGDTEIVIYRHGQVVDWETIFHELAHRFTHAHFLRIPVWLDEGLATYLGNSVVENGKLVLGKRYRNWLSSVKPAVQSQKYLPLKELFNMQSRDFYSGPRETLHYAQSWGVVHFLMHMLRRRSGSSRHAAAQVRRFFQESAGGRCNAYNIERIFRTRLDHFEARWTEYIATME
jgi:hypothetical protein